MLPSFPFRTLLDLLFPPVCPACDHARAHPLEDPAALPGLCSDCQYSVLFSKEPRCSVCGEPFASPDSDPFTCTTCRGRRFAFDFALARCRSAGTVREVLHKFKYGRDLTLARTLAQWMTPLLEEPRIAARHDWLLVPVPLHPRKRREREFNQAAELARWLSKSTGLPRAALLRRTRYTASQTGFHRDQRARNLKGAFSLRPRAVERAGLEGRSLILVDDVFTTGSTTHECARVLRTGGAEMVVVLTVARG